MSVSVGSDQRFGEGGKSHRAIRLVVHPDYIPELRADIAIVRTASRFDINEFVKPIPLAREFIPEGAEVVLTGWGLLGDVRRLSQGRKIILNLFKNFSLF